MSIQVYTYMSCVETGLHLHLMLQKRFTFTSIVLVSGANGSLGGRERGRGGEKRGDREERCLCGKLNRTEVTLVGRQERERGERERGERERQRESAA